MKLQKRFLGILLAVGYTFLVSAQAQMPPIPIDEKVRIGKLENGLTYYIRQNQKPEKQANFYIAQKVGSIMEEENQRGLAHFLEHMCFNGTQNFPGNGLIKYLETIGVKFGENLNAYTSIDETVYNIDNVPTTVPGAIDSCLLILHDWADGLLLAGEDIDKERGVIHEEWRSRSVPMIRMYEKALPKIYPNNRYGNRMPIGLMSVVDNFPHQVLRDYYEKWYRPDLQGIVVVGDINVDEIEAKIKAIFSTIKTPVNPAERTYFQVADNKEPIIVLEKDKEQKYAVTYIFNKHEAIPNEAKGDMSYLVYNYAQNMISTMLNARINELMQQAEPPFIQASAGDDDFFIAKTKKSFMGYLATKEDGLEKGITSLYREMLRAHRFGFTATEYARAKAEYMRNLESAFEEREKTQSVKYAKEYVRHFIDNEPIPGIENEFTLMNQLTPNIPVEVVNSIMKTLMNDSNLVVVSFCPDVEGFVYPTADALKEAIKKVENEQITAYVDKVSDEPLIAQEPTPGKVVKTKNAAFGYKKLTLSNGATVYLKNTDFKADQILMSAISKGGTSRYSELELANLKMMNDVANAGGVGNFSVTELDKVLAGKKASVSTSVNLYGERANGNCSPKDLETMLQLTYLKFTAPRYDEEACTSLLKRQKAILQNQENDPSTTLSDSLISSLYSNHPRARRMKAEQIDQVNCSRALDIFRERFDDASDFSFIFTGNIDEAVAIPLIEKYIGGLPSTHSKENYNNVHLDMFKGEFANIFEKEMQTPKATVVVALNGDCKYSLKNDLLMDLTRQILDIVYTEEVREKEGGTYGVGVEGATDYFFRDNAYLLISFETDPEKRDKMTQIIIDQLHKMATEGPSEVNLNKVKEFNLKSYTEGLKENGYWTRLMTQYLSSGVDFGTTYEQTLKSITVKDVQKFMKNLISQGNLMEVAMTSKK